MTKTARNGMIAILALILCACLMLFFAPTAALRAKAEGNALTDVPFEVEDGVLYTVPGGEGIIATKEAYTIKNDLTVYFKFTVLQESIDFYLGENLDYWLHVTTEGIFPGVWVANTAIGEEKTAFHQRFHGLDFKVGDELDLRILCRKGSMTFNLKNLTTGDKTHTPLSAKVNSEGRDATMWKDTSKYTTKTDYAANLDPLRVAIACSPNQKAAISEFRILEAGKGKVLDAFDTLSADMWMSKDKVSIQNGALVLPRNNNKTIATTDAIVKDGNSIGLRVKVPYGKMTVKAGDNAVEVPATALTAEDWSNVIINVKNDVASVLADGAFMGSFAVQEAMPLTLAFEGEDAAIIDHLRVYDMTGLILNDEFTYMNGDVWTGLTTMQLDLAELLVPIWEGNTAYQEGLWVVAEQNGKVADIDLLHKIDTIVEITSMDGKIVYEQGKDYTVTAAGKLAIPEGSAIPVMSYNAYHNAGGDLGVYYQADNLWHERQVKVTYTFVPDGKITVPETKDSLLPKTVAKLENGERLNVVTFGDSITEGASTTGHPFGVNDLGRAAWQKSWAMLLGEALQAIYPQADVNLQSSGFGGTGAGWAFGGHGEVESLNYAAYRDYVLPFDPDLIVLAFGMNDSGTSTGYYNEAFVKVLIAALQTACPDAEIILVSPMMQHVDKIRQQGENKNMCLVGMAEAYLSHEKTGLAVADVSKIHQEVMGYTRREDKSSANQFGFREWYLEKTGTGKNFRDTSGNNFNHPNDYLSRIYAQTILKTITERTLPLTTDVDAEGTSIIAYYTSDLPLITEKDIRAFKDRFGAVLVDETGSLVGAASSVSLSAEIALPETEVSVTMAGFTDTLVIPTEEYQAMELIVTYENTDTVIYTTSALTDLKPFITVKVRYNDGSEKKTGSYELSGELTAGDSTVTVTAQGVSATITVAVTEVAIQSITAAVKEDAILFVGSEAEDVKEAIIVTATYSNGMTAEVDDFTVAFNGTQVLRRGENEITVTVGEFTTTVTVVGEVVALASITATYTPVKTVYAGASLLSLRMLVTVTGTNNDGSDAVIDDFELSLASGETKISEGENEVIVTVNGVTTTIIVTGTKVELVAIYADIDTEGVILYEGELLANIYQYIILIGKNNDGSSVRLSGFEIAMEDEVTVLARGENKVIVTYGEFNTRLTVEVEAKVTPTVEPTVAPTVAPTVEPTVEPTEEPSLEPSKESDGKNCGSVAPTGGGNNNAGGMTFLILSLAAVALFLTRKKNA